MHVLTETTKFTADVIVLNHPDEGIGYIFRDLYEHEPIPNVYLNIGHPEAAIHGVRYMDEKQIQDCFERGQTGSTPQRIGSCTVSVGPQHGSTPSSTYTAQPSLI